MMMTYPGSKNIILALLSIFAALFFSCACGSTRPDGPERMPPDSPGHGAEWQKVFAVEKLGRCSRFSGAWLIVYSGTATTPANDEEGVLVRLEERISYRFDPQESGQDSTSWFCVPRKRHCYSRVAFSDWGGKHHPGDLIVFKRGDVFPKSEGLIKAMTKALRERCPILSPKNEGSPQGQYQPKIQSPVLQK